MTAAGDPEAAAGGGNGHRAPAVAAIDIGTNSVRLLVRRDGADVVRLTTITRLGQGVGVTGMLTAEAIERTLDCLGAYRAILDAHGVSRVRMVATSAARDATNRDELFDAAAGVVGVRPELLDGDEEGQLAFAGATAGLDPADGPFLVVDIGGGSTEFVVGTTTAEGVLSVDVGCVRLTEAELHHDPPLPEELTNAIGLVADHVEDVLREMPLAAEARTVVGVAGTVTTVAAVELGLASYDRDQVHHFRLSRAAAEDVFRTLATEALEDRVHNPGLQRERADVIVGGCCILVGILRKLGASEMLVSDSDLLDALAAGLEGPA
jgi:exopolyphosphatase/guanosine-5'-triphosphate,3'-diphosphate pyrophosphatase